MKKLKVLSMAMISLFALTGCDVEMDLDKTNAEAAIVLEDGATTYGNKLQEIYDSVVNYGDTNSQRILNNILFAYAQVYFGEFYKLNQLVDESNVNAIKEFKAFAAKEGETDADVLVRAKIFRNSILTAIKKDFWNSVKNGSYQTRQTFIEEKFVDAQKANLYNMIEPAAYEDTYDKHAINGSKTYENVGDYYVGGLGTYQLDGSDVTNGTGILGRYSDYIRRSLMPEQGTGRRYRISPYRQIPGGKICHKAEWERRSRCFGISFYICDDHPFGGSRRFRASDHPALDQLSFREFFDKTGAAAA